ncbi:hypothetical protein Tco_0490619 [Tanacetum coccineum]
MKNAIYTHESGDLYVLQIRQFIRASKGAIYTILKGGDLYLPERRRFIPSLKEVIYTILKGGDLYHPLKEAIYTEFYGEIPSGGELTIPSGGELTISSEGDLTGGDL